MTDQPYRVRPMRDLDVPFVCTSWLQAYEPQHYTSRWREREYLQHGNRQLGSRLKNRYYETHRPVVHELIGRGVVRVVVARDDDDVICGWACGERDAQTGVRVMHYCYVKSIYRGIGVARAAVESVLDELGDEGEVVMSHLGDTKRVGRLMQRLQWPHVPYLAFVRAKESAA